MMTSDGIRDKGGIVLIGAGNLAVNLGLALHRKGYSVRQVYSRTEEAARTLAERLSADHTTSPEQICDDAGLYIVALKDSVLTELIPQITAGRPDALFVHTAGSMPMDVWAGHARRYGVFYPMQTFSKARPTDFGGIPVFVEANGADDLSLLRSLAQDLSGRVYVFSSEQRRLLHLAGVFACNFTNHLYAITEELLAAHGIPFEVMLPLIDETAAKVHGLSPREAQTGPAVRYDLNVIGKHLDLLADRPEMQQLYRLLSESIHRISENN